MSRTDDTDNAPPPERSGPKTGAWIAISVVAVCVAGGGGYFLGWQSGADLDAARSRGERRGQAEGAARGAARGYEAGVRAGRRAGYKQTYKRAYDAAYQKALRGE